MEGQSITTGLGSKAKADWPTKVVPATMREGCERSEQTLDYAGEHDTI